jgi:hypothetical protein
VGAGAVAFVGGAVIFPFIRLLLAWTREHKKKYAVGLAILGVIIPVWWLLLLSILLGA